MVGECWVRVVSARIGERDFEQFICSFSRNRLAPACHGEGVSAFQRRNEAAFALFEVAGFRELFESGLELCFHQLFRGSAEAPYFLGDYFCADMASELPIKAANGVVAFPEVHSHALSPSFRP